MFKLMTATLVLCGAAIAAQAADGDKPQRDRPALTEAQKKERQTIIDKYDTNKDGRLDADERKSMTADDKEKLAKASGRAPQKKQ